MKFFHAVLLFALAHGHLSAQTGEKTPNSAPNDTFSLHRIFKNGKFQGRIRQFSMLTDNAPGLTDYHGIAIGASIKYETREWHGLHLSMEGEFVDDLHSSDFTKPDPVTNAYNRYDAGLYEVLELDNKDFVARLSDLNLVYRFRKNRLVWGKQVLKTPLVNPQDGRMNATMVEGIYGYFDPSPLLHLEGGWLYGASPRSSNRWFSLSNSMGIYPQGLTTNGTRAAYKGNIQTAGLFMANARLTTRFGRLDAWDYLLENTLNTALLQWEKSLFLNKTKHQQLHLGAQAILQRSLNDGGNADPAKTYAPKGMKSRIWGGYIAWSKGGLRLQANTTRITGQGQFLFPREWGREPLFTFLPRERNEGAGDVWAFSGNISYKIPHTALAWNLGAGHYQMPDVKNAVLNKYSLPSYNQINLDLKYRFSGALEGLEGQFLFVYKQNKGNLYHDERYRINKVDLGNYNLVFNYGF